MIKVCSNGDRPRGSHPAVPITPDELAADAVECVRAGAAALHVHPRDSAVFAAVVGTLAIASLVASFLPARRVTRIDPVLALSGD